MRWSKTLIPTVKEIPQDAEIASHQLMLRAGMIRKLSGGLYTFLPLGLRALRRIERIVREEMDRAGAIEILMPALQPREIWERTGRYATLRDTMFKILDRQNRHLVLGPTHEEVVTDLVAHEINSYRQLPKTFYQIQTKFRDEIRPRFGLMRAKEFVMKDAYSFDTSWEGVEKSYQAMYDAYVRIFERVGLRAKAVEADSGAMGGSASHEFMVLAESGEDGIVECGACAYAANTERAERRLAPAAAAPEPPAASRIATPGCRTIEQVSAYLKVPPENLIKTLICLVKGQPAAVCIPGHRELNEHKLARALGADVQMADEATVEKVTGAPLGFAGPMGLALPIYADAELADTRFSVAGANAADTHVVNLRLARDARVTAWHDLVLCRELDLCPRCGQPMREKRGVEVGHVFKLGVKYSQALEAGFLDESGNRQTCIMGCYGIGVTRTLQAVIEQSHDANGIVWPASVAPFEVAVLPLNVSHPETMRVADELVAALEGQGLEVLMDDRDERPGFKFKDADLIGFPVRAVVSERSLAEGKIEIKRRSGSDKQMVPIDQAAGAIAALVRL